uniref:Uncharacterized protein n=1 Tax=Geladintestivirus 3 TaxID=3233135 RepID=A0AAU8MIE7_9CAUD
MPISKDYQTIICHTEQLRSGNKNSKSQVRILMTWITDEEEALLDKGRAISIERGGIRFDLDSDNVFSYGQVDLHDGSDDYNALNELIPFRDIVHLPAYYDYNTHTCKTKVNSYQTYETDNIGAMAQYAHGKLDKPNKVVIFKLIAKRW